MIKKYIYFLPSLLIMSTIFYLSSLPSTGIDGTKVEQFLIHKTFHIFVYASLSASFYFALNKSNQKPIKNISTSSLVFTYLYGVSDEIHQYFIPGRGAKFTDTLFDLFGAFLGILIYRQLIKTSKK